MANTDGTGTASTRGISRTPSRLVALQAAGFFKKKPRVVDEADTPEEATRWVPQECIKKLNDLAEKKAAARNEEKVDAVRAFLPLILQKPADKVSQHILHRCNGCVVFSDASGFTELTDRLASRPNGSELLSNCLNKFFTPLINIIEAYRGDVMKFSGDALTILFEATDDYLLHPFPCGSPESPAASRRKTMEQLCCLRASACCLEIHKRLHNFEADAGDGNVRLTLHIGVGYGSTTILQVGGVRDRFEFVIAGNPMDQIAIAEGLADRGETVLSPEAWGQVKDMVIEGAPIPNGKGFHRLAALDTRLHTYPSVKQAAQECSRIAAEKSSKDDKQYPPEALKEFSEQFIPRAVLKHLQSGNTTSINEMRSVTIIFARIGGVDVSTDEGSKVASELMIGMQQACYDFEGSLNKFLVDDKGLLFLFVFGLPPLVHIDDPQRAVTVCFDMLEVLKSMGLSGQFGLATGRVFCGIVGSRRRREYTVMGDTANLAARLMSAATDANPVLMDEVTFSRTHQDIFCRSLGAKKMKGKPCPVPVYAPSTPGVCGLRLPQLEGMYQDMKGWDTHKTELMVEVTGLKNKAHLRAQMPWRACSECMGGSSPVLKLTRWRELQKVEGTVSHGLLTQGGSLCMLGTSGIGKEELCEYVVEKAASSGVIPIFGVMRLRRRERWSAVLQVIQNCVCVLAGVDCCGTDMLPEATVEDIIKTYIPARPPSLRQACGFLGFKCAGQVNREKIEEDPSLEGDIVEVAATLVKAVADKHAILVVLRLRRGPDIVDGLKAKASCFWKLVARLSSIATQLAKEISGGRRCHPIAVLTIARKLPGQEITSAIPTLQRQEVMNVMVLDALTQDAAVELMCHCLGLATSYGGSLVKRSLRDYVVAVSIKVPLYIQECLNHLVAEKCVRAGNGECHILQDLNSVSIAEWVQTSMVGNTMAQLVELGSAKGHIMKLATAFEGFFTPLDLAAANLALFGRIPYVVALQEQRKLLKACRELVKLKLLKEVPRTNLAATGAWAPACLPRWTISNTLVRKVAGSMVLTSQRLSIRRSVLIDRALNVELPKRLGQDMAARKVKLARPQPGVPMTMKQADNEAVMVRGISMLEGGAGPDPVWSCLLGDGDDIAEVLSAACALGNRSAVRALLARENVQEAINEKTQVGGHTPLHFACSSGELEIVQLLVLKQAQVDMKNLRSETPLLIAAQRGHVEVVQYLTHQSVGGGAALEDPRYWERMLPEITAEKDVPPPLMPAFKPPAARDSLNRSRKDALRMILQRLAADKAGTSREFVSPINSGALGAVVVDVQNSGRQEQALTSRSPSKLAASFGFSTGTRISSKQRAHSHSEDDSERESRMVGVRSTDTSGCRRRGGPKKVHWASTEKTALLGKVRLAVRNMMRTRRVLVVMLVALVLALYVPDIWVAIGATSNTGSDTILTIVMLMFLSEVLLLSFSDSSYPFSFFFFMDCVGTLSMVWDISFLLGASATKMQESRGVGGDEMTIFRATRTAKIGARAGRLSRLVKVLRFLPGLGTSRKGQDAEKLQQISTQLTNVLSKRVAGMTILLVMLMPIFTIGLYPEADFSTRVWVEGLSRRAAVSEVAAMEEPLRRFAAFYSSKEYGPYEVCITARQGSSADEEVCYMLAGAPWSSGFDMPDRPSFRVEVEEPNAKAFFDWTVPAKSEANMGIALISLVIVLMCGACLLLNYSASELAVRPLERMLMNIKTSARVIFASTEGTGGNDEDFGEALDGEVALLERIVKKIATLAELHSKKPFDEAYMKNMKGEELGVLAMTAGSGMLPTESTGLPNERQEGRARLEQTKADVTGTMEWQLEEMGIDYHELNSWAFDCAKLERPIQEQISVWLLMHNPGSCDFTEHNVELRKLQAFVELVAAEYKSNPYHCFIHAVDVTHAVFHYLTLMQGELLFSMLEQFSMLVSAVCHDIGHIGFNNAFLTEVQHDLAVRYNDRAPLENMHCCKTFEILANPAVNIFIQVPKEQKSEVRKLIIDVILHTDMTQHNPMVKELELLFEMNSKVFQKTDEEQLTEEEVEVLSNVANKKLVLKALLHSADLSNPAKPWKIAEAWATRVLEEYFAQGDEEKKRGIPVQMLNDRFKVSKPNSQIGFVEFVIAPLVSVEAKLFRAWHMLGVNLTYNMYKWEELLIAESSPTDEERAKVKERIQRIVGRVHPEHHVRGRSKSRKMTADTLRPS